MKSLVLRGGFQAAPPADLGKPETLPAAPLPSVSPEPAPEPAAKVVVPKGLLDITSYTLGY